jgi:hypothetical protein
VLLCVALVWAVRYSWRIWLLGRSQQMQQCVSIAACTTACTTVAATFTKFAACAATVAAHASSSAPPVATFAAPAVDAPAITSTTVAEPSATAKSAALVSAASLRTWTVPRWLRRLHSKRLVQRRRAWYVPRGGRSLTRVSKFALCAYGLPSCRLCDFLTAVTCLRRERRQPLCDGGGLFRLRRSAVCLVHVLGFTVESDSQEGLHQC